MTEIRYIHIPKWEQLQYDKRRKGAPWHQEYARQLDNDDYLELSLSARGVLHGLRLMYGRRHPEGIGEQQARTLLCPSDADARYWRRHLTALNDAGFITLSARKVLAERAQNAGLDVDRDIEGLSSKQANTNGNTTAWTCQDCAGLTFRTETRLLEHRENVHADYRVENADDIPEIETAPITAKPAAPPENPSNRHHRRRFLSGAAE